MNAWTLTQFLLHVQMASNTMWKLNNALVIELDRYVEAFTNSLNVTFPILIDINECELDIGSCPGDKQCKNIPGGYDCVDSKKNSMYVHAWTAYQAQFPTDTNTIIFVVASFWILFRNRMTDNSPFSPHRKNLTCSKGFKQHFDKCVGKFSEFSTCFVFRIPYHPVFFLTWKFSIFLRKLDIDECTVDKTACDSNQNCINMPGSFRCECKIGFTMDKVVNACVGKQIFEANIY